MYSACICAVSLLKSADRSSSFAFTCDLVCTFRNALEALRYSPKVSRQSA